MKALKRRRRREPRPLQPLLAAGPEGPVVGQYAALVKTLTDARHSLGLTQEQLDHKIGLARGHVGKLEILTRIPRADFLVLWAMGAGYDIELVPRKPR